MIEVWRGMSLLGAVRDNKMAAAIAVVDPASVKATLEQIRKHSNPISAEQIDRRDGARCCSPR